MLILPLKITVVYTSLHAPLLTNNRLQHGSRKDGYQNHTHHAESCLAHLRHNNTSGCTYAFTRTGAVGPTAASPSTARSRAGPSTGCASCRRRVVAVTEDSSRSNTVFHEAVLEVGHRLLNRQTVVTAIAIEGLHRCGLAAFLEDRGCVASEGQGGAANGTSDIFCRKLRGC